MKAASLKELKTELATLHPNRLMELCMQLAKYKKDNKEYLTYLLFESDDEQHYISEVKGLLDEMFREVNKSNLYLAKKSVRKILRHTDKYVRYSASEQTEVELRIHFCKQLKKSKIPMAASTALGNIYQRQLVKIGKALSKLHDDLQFDYADSVKLLY